MNLYQIITMYLYFNTFKANDHYFCNKIFFESLREIKKYNDVEVITNKINDDYILEFSNSNKFKSIFVEYFPQFKIILKYLNQNSYELIIESNSDLFKIDPTRTYEGLNIDYLRYCFINVIPELINTGKIKELIHNFKCEDPLEQFYLFQDMTQIYYNIDTNKFEIDADEDKFTYLKIKEKIN